MMNPQVIKYDYGGDEIPGLFNFERGRVDLVFADPPYNQGVKYADDPTRDRMRPDTYRFDLVARSLYQLSDTMRPGATLWWLCPVDHVNWIGGALEEIIGPRMYLITWHERFAQYQGDRGLTRDFRLLYVHRKDGPPPTRGAPLPTWNPDAIRIESERQKIGDKRANPAGRVPGTVWRGRRLQGTAKDRVPWHPTQLPPELLDRIILGWTNEGDVVLDAFAGSGSMGVRCQEHGRHFIGVERSAIYCEKILERLGCGNQAV